MDRYRAVAQNVVDFSYAVLRDLADFRESQRDGQDWWIAQCLGVLGRVKVDKAYSDTDRPSTLSCPFFVKKHKSQKLVLRRPNPNSTNRSQSFFFSVAWISLPTERDSLSARHYFFCLSALKRLIICFITRGEGAVRG